MMQRNIPHVKDCCLAPQVKKLLNIFFVAGFPELESTGTIIHALQNAGADVIEIGIPFSDPLADGPVIQESSAQALKNGMTLDKLFQQLDDIEAKVPLLLMGYLNPVLQFGIDRFCRRCNQTGISGVIIPDLPLELYQQYFASHFDQHDLSMIFMITPQTSDERVRMIDSFTTSFIYAISSASTTGNRQFQTDTADYLLRISALKLQHAVLTGFNIHDKASFNAATRHTQGGIIGSAFIRCLSESNSYGKNISEFIQSIRP